MARVLIADRHPLFADGLASLLEREGHSIVGQFTSATELIDRVEALRPDAIIIDKLLPPGGAIEFLSHAEKSGLNVPVIVCADTVSEDELKYLQTIAHCIIGKRNNPQSYVACIRKALAGNRCCTITSSSSGIQSILAHLSPKEQEIAKYVQQGKRNSEIADRTSITEGTVKVHLSRIYKKLDIKSRIQLVLLLQSQSENATM